MLILICASGASAPGRRSSRTRPSVADRRRPADHAVRIRAAIGAGNAMPLRLDARHPLDLAPDTRRREVISAPDPRRAMVPTLMFFSLPRIPK